MYAGLPDVDLWDEARDARLYAGPWPVVAHPPCPRWSMLGMCRGYYDGEDEGCFKAALSAVREYGGVLEHPRYTLAWKRFGLPRPQTFGWVRSLIDDGWTTEVDQGTYGFPIRKPTWLYYIGPEPPELDWGLSRLPTYRAKWVGGGIAGSSRGRQRSATPPAFRDVLLEMARSAATVAA